MEITTQQRKKIISAARGVLKADVVFRNGWYLNVFTNRFEKGDVAIKDGYIVGVDDYEGVQEIDISGKILCPGFIDGHIHIESSMLAPSEFAKAVIPCGTTAVIADPHEIANVAGKEGIRFMLERSEGLPLDVFYMLPSCVPATPLDEAGAVLQAEDLEEFYKEERVLGLAELMNAFGTVRNDEEILKKIAGAKSFGKCIDGHAPGLLGKELNAYIAAGVNSDHECSMAEEAIEKLKRGQFIMIRQGTAAQNLKALIPLLDPPYCERCMLVSDDKHPGDILENGHLNSSIRCAIKRGKSPEIVYKVASYNAARYFGLKDRGAIAPGYRADLLVLSDVKEVTIDQVYKNGKLVAENGKLTSETEAEFATLKSKEQEEGQYPKVFQSFHLKEVRPEDFAIKGIGSKKRVIEMVPGEILTFERIVPANLDAASENASSDHLTPAPGVELDKDIIKIAVVERHHDTGHIGVGFTTGYGIRYGAIASSVAHDSHNLIVAGTNDTDMALAANAVRNNEGGLAIAIDGKVVADLPLPIAGLMCDMSAEKVEEKLQKMKELAKEMGVEEGIDPFMTLAFTALPVIPQLRILTKGLVDVSTQSYVPVLFDEE